MRALTTCLLLTLAREDFGALSRLAPAMQAAIEQMAAKRMREVAAPRATT